MKIIVAIFLASFSCSSMASFYNGNKLKDSIDSYDRVSNNKVIEGDYANAARGMGYIVGVADTLDYLSITCTPNGASVGQIVAIVSKYIKDNPDKWMESANHLVGVSLQKSFPCEKSKIDTLSTP
jgi:hypothetical protein